MKLPEGFSTFTENVQMQILKMIEAEIVSKMSAEQITIYLQNSKESGLLLLFHLLI
jgi:hypothetical protein